MGIGMPSNHWMTVGELAAKMGVTVRTLQYYDREGIVRPSHLSEGGRRLYDERDMARLHQVLSMKFLGFSLKDIRERLSRLETPADVERALAEQAAAIEAKIASLEEARETIRELRKEVIQMEKVDWKKYADIIELLRMKENMYWVVKYMSDETMKRLSSIYNLEEANDIFGQWMQLAERAAQLQAEGEAPNGIRAQQLAADWWGMVDQVAKGDMEVLQNLMQFNEKKDGWGNERIREAQERIDEFIGQAMGIFFEANRIALPAEFQGKNEPESEEQK